MALETLSNLWDRNLMNHLTLLLEDMTLEEKASLVEKMIEPTGFAGETLLDWALSHPDPILRLSCRCFIWEQGISRRDLPVNQEEMTLMRRLMMLRKVPLFSELTLEQLEIISRIVTETEFYAGEIIFKENDMGDSLYIVVSGKVKIIKKYGTSDEIVLAELGEMAHFGEMAVLSDEPRSATALVSEDAKLISLKGERLKEIILQKPEMAFQIMRVLSERLKAADGRVEELRKDVLNLRKALARLQSSSAA
jgi:CRP-like cAMP-binding protein